MEINLVMYVLAFLGLVLSVLTKVMKALSVNHKSFSWKTYWMENLVRNIIGLLSIVALFMMFPDLPEIMGFKETAITGHRVMAFVIGYLNYTVIKWLLDMVENKTNINITKLDV
jgi:uncharacterized membrane protein